MAGIVEQNLGAGRVKFIDFSADSKSYLKQVIIEDYVDVQSIPYEKREPVWEDLMTDSVYDKLHYQQVIRQGAGKSRFKMSYRLKMKRGLRPYVAPRPRTPEESVPRLLLRDSKPTPIVRYGVAVLKEHNYENKVAMSGSHIVRGKAAMMDHNFYSDQTEEVVP